MTFAPELSPESEFEDRRKKTFWERLEDVSATCLDGHKRLRGRLEQLEAQCDEHAIAIGKNMTRIEAMEKGPVEATKLRFSAGVMATALCATVTIVGAGYGIGSSVTARIDALVVQLDQQRVEREATAKLLDERYQTQKVAIDALTRQMELLKYEQQRLREDVTGKKGGR